MKELLEIFYNDDDGPSLLVRYPDEVEKFVTQYFELQTINGNQYLLPPNISALNDVLSECSNRYKFKQDGFCLFPLSNACDTAANVPPHEIPFEREIN